MVPEFRPIPSFPGYLISTNGQVYRSDPNARPVRIRRNNGYLWASLRPAGAKRVTCRQVGALVLETFVSPRAPGAICCHCNDVRDDNRLENLYWGNAVQNAADRLRNGKGNRGRKRITVEGLVRYVRLGFVLGKE